MPAQTNRNGRPTRANMTTMRDPLVPLDFGGWFRRVYQTFRRSFVSLSVLSLLTVSMGAVYFIVLDAIRPSPTELQQRLLQAAEASPTGTVEPQTQLMIQFGPLIPSMVIFTVLIGLASAVSYGGGYHVALRQANGQPIGAGEAIRTTAPRVLPFVGWCFVTWLAVMVVFVGLMLPGTLAGEPWLQVVASVVALAIMVGVGVSLLATIFGVVFLERAGLKRCFQLIKGRFWITSTRVLATLVIYLGYALLTNGAVKLLLWPFGGQQALGHVALAVLHIANAIIAIPLMVFLIAATLVSYAELRFREDRSITTRTLVAG
jgi:hypothetical protein